MTARPHPLLRSREPGARPGVVIHMAAEAAGRQVDTATEIEQHFAAAPTMGRLARVRYTHADMIDFIIANPSASQGNLASRYGYTESWISNVMASDAWKAAMAARREELVDPALLATIEERFRAVAEKSLERLMDKLTAPVVSDNVVLKAVELGAKALGVGGHGAPQAPKDERNLVDLAARMIELQAGIRSRPEIDVTPKETLDGTATEVR